MITTTSATSSQSDSTGFIYGSHFEPGKLRVVLDLPEIVDTFRHVEGEGIQDIFARLHPNLSWAGCLCWLQSCLELPEPPIKLLGEEVYSTRTEQQDGALIAIFDGVIFDFERTPAQVATQWVYTHWCLLVTLRREPLHSVGRLRECIHNGETFRSPTDLLGHLMCDQADLMTQVVCVMGIDIDCIEDRFLVSKITPERWEFAGTRCMLVWLQRVPAPEPGPVFRLPTRPSMWLHPGDVQQLHELTEEFSAVLRDISGLIECIKPPQEEVTARLDEQSNRTLFTLMLVTVLALPISIIAGPLGMNVGGVPLVDSHHGFRSMVGLVAMFIVIVTWWTVHRRNNH